MRLILVCLCCLVLSSPAFAADQAALIERAQAAEKGFLPAEAARLYREAEGVDPGSRVARRARARLEWLGERSEGDYRPLAALMRMRAQSAVDAPALAAFAAEVEGFPAGRVRREALQLLADGYARVGDAERALAGYEAWLAADGLTESERQLASAGAALTRAKLGQPEAAESGLEQAGLGKRPEAVFLRAERIGRIGVFIAGALLLLFIGLGVAWGGWRGLSWRGVRRAFTLPRLGVALYVLAVPVFIVWLYDHHIVKLWVAPYVASALVVATAAIIGAGVRGSARRRQALAVLGAGATLGAAFIAVARSRLLFDIMTAWGNAP